MRTTFFFFHKSIRGSHVCRTEDIDPNGSRTNDEPLHHYYSVFTVWTRSLIWSQLHICEASRRNSVRRETEIWTPQVKVPKTASVVFHATTGVSTMTHNLEKKIWIDWLEKIGHQHKTHKTKGDASVQSVRKKLEETTHLRLTDINWDTWITSPVSSLISTISQYIDPVRQHLIMSIVALVGRILRHFGSYDHCSVEVPPVVMLSRCGCQATGGVLSRLLPRNSPSCKPTLTLLLSIYWYLSIHFFNVLDK